MDKKLEEMIPVHAEAERSIKNVVESEKMKLEEKGEDGINFYFKRKYLANSK